MTAVTWAAWYDMVLRLFIKGLPLSLPPPLSLTLYEVYLVYIHHLVETVMNSPAVYCLSLPVLSKGICHCKLNILSCRCSQMSTQMTGVKGNALRVSWSCISSLCPVSELWYSFMLALFDRDKVFI